MKFIKVNITPETPPVYINSDLVELITSDGTGCVLWIGDTRYSVIQDISTILEMISY